jgi:hypothetical protein
VANLSTLPAAVEHVFVEMSQRTTRSKLTVLTAVKAVFYGVINLEVSGILRKIGSAESGKLSTSGALGVAQMADGRVGDSAASLEGGGSNVATGSQQSLYKRVKAKLKWSRGKNKAGSAAAQDDDAILAGALAQGLDLNALESLLDIINREFQVLILSYISMNESRYRPCHLLAVLENVCEMLYRDAFEVLSRCQSC